MKKINIYYLVLSLLASLANVTNATTLDLKKKKEKFLIDSMVDTITNGEQEKEIEKVLRLSSQVELVEKHEKTEEDRSSVEERMRSVSCFDVEKIGIKKCPEKKVKSMSYLDYEEDLSEDEESDYEDEESFSYSESLDFKNEKYIVDLDIYCPENILKKSRKKIVQLEAQVKILNEKNIKNCKIKDLKIELLKKVELVRSNEEKEKIELLVKEIEDLKKEELVRSNEEKKKIELLVKEIEDLKKVKVVLSRKNAIFYAVLLLVIGLVLTYCIMKAISTQSHTVSDQYDDDYSYNENNYEDDEFYY